MHIREATAADLSKIESIYEQARAFMRACGNREQWQGGYPDRAVIQKDLERGELYLVCEEEELLGVFVYFFAEEPTYRILEGGEWLAPTRPYGVLHRVAVAASAHGRGVGKSIFRYAIAAAKNVRIDTHVDNVPMRRALEKNGFSHRGTIYLANGDSRLAYQYVASDA